MVIAIWVLICLLIIDLLCIVVMSFLNPRKHLTIFIVIEHFLIMLLVGLTVGVIILAILEFAG